MVIVVGAGLAGLEAAATLSAAGREVRVLEARDRVGGRVHSRTLANGALAEMGAEFILPGDTYIRERVEELGLGLWEKGVRYGRREPRGGPPVSWPEIDAALVEIQRALRAERGADRRSVADLLAGLAITPGAREYVLARCEISTAAAATSVPAAELLGLAQFGDLPSPSVAGGNQRLATALAGRIGAGRIELGAQVTAIEAGPDRVLVRTAEEELSAAAAIVAIPARVIGGLELDPALPQEQVEAYRSVEYGHAAKLFVPLRSTPEIAAVMSVPGRFWSWSATADAARPQALVSAFAGSARALRRLATERGPERWLGALAGLRPELELEREAAVLSTWSDDPLVGGAYSVAVGPERAQLMREPHAEGRIQFAGEHLAGEFAAQMEGALRSGRDAALRLLGGRAGASIRPR